MGEDGIEDAGEGPKTPEVITLLRGFPTELESDIAHFYPGRSVLEWWRDEMSSREFMVLVNQLPDKSAFGKARREGDWTEDQYIQADQNNELRRLRYQQASLVGAKMRKPDLLLSPRQRVEKDQDRQFSRDLHDMLVAQMSGKFVPPTRQVSFVTGDADDRKQLMDGG